MKFVIALALAAAFLVPAAAAAPAAPVTKIRAARLRHGTRPA